MLYIPFRDEQKEILNCELKFKYELLLSHQILQARNQYLSSMQQEIEEAVELFENIDPDQRE